MKRATMLFTCILSLVLLTATGPAYSQVVEIEMCMLNPTEAPICFEVIDASFAINAQGAPGNTSTDHFTVTKFPDKTSPVLLAAIQMGTFFESARLNFRFSDAPPGEFLLQIRVRNADPENFSGSVQQGSGFPLETIEIFYTEIRYRVGEDEVCFDRRTGKPC